MCPHCRARPCQASPPPGEQHDANLGRVCSLEGDFSCSASWCSRETIIQAWNARQGASARGWVHRWRRVVHNEMLSASCTHHWQDGLRLRT